MSRPAYVRNWVYGLGACALALLILVLAVPLLPVRFPAGRDEPPRLEATPSPSTAAPTSSGERGAPPG